MGKQLKIFIFPNSMHSVLTCTNLGLFYTWTQSDKHEDRGHDKMVGTMVNSIIECVPINLLAAAPLPHTLRVQSANQPHADPVISSHDAYLSCLVRVNRS